MPVSYEYLSSLKPLPEDFGNNTTLKYFTTMISYEL